MKRTKTRTTAIFIIILIIFTLGTESCGLGKKSCGCGMDLNGSTQKHKLFRR